MKYLAKYILIGLIGVSAFGLGALAQTPESSPAPLNTFQADQEKLCTIQPMTVERTYAFRPLPRADRNAGWYARKSWIQKIFPFLKKTETRFQLDDIRYMEKKIGRPIPIDETKQTKKINSRIEQTLIDEQTVAESAWNEWLTKNPNATAEERERAQQEIRFKGMATVRRSRFDWRENGLELGDVGFQGFDCNTCWAFASVDALLISRRLALMRGQVKALDDEFQPSARQLISCMVPKDRYCQSNWHGAAFTFMIESGLPLGGSDRYDASPAAHLCDAERTLRPLTWGYVSDTPQKVSAPDEIKKAVVMYGSVVTMMTFDRCLWLYGSGVFNEQQNRDGSHILTIVGWDDTKGKNGAWLVKNSYGEEWGEAGFGWFEYGANNIGQFSAVVVADPNEKIESAESLKKPAK